MVHAMRIALIADAYPPMRTSAAVQLRDLAQELLKQGYFPTVIIPSSSLNIPWLLEDMNGVQVLRVKAPPTKDIGYIRRTVNEFLLPFFMLYNLRKSLLAKVKWDGVIWYSPTIFLGPIADYLKKASRCRSYLIVRDIFPEWAVDMGLMSRGLPYRFFKAVEHYQYSVADVVGVQTPGNVAYFNKKKLKSSQRVEVLHNWLSDAVEVKSSISVHDTSLAGRKIFVYAGNMGVAQGMMILIDLVERLYHRKDIGFLFVGRGVNANRLRQEAIRRKLNNVIFFDEIDSSEIPDLYAQCHAGIVSLDARHKTHNIPGKFLTYMQGGLPVLANINLGNDLADMIRKEQVGEVCESNQLEDLLQSTFNLIKQLETDSNISIRCKALYSREFTSERAVRKIIKDLYV